MKLISEKEIEGRLSGFDFHCKCNGEFDYPKGFKDGCSFAEEKMKGLMVEFVKYMKARELKSAGSAFGAFLIGMETENDIIEKFMEGRK